MNAPKVSDVDYIQFLIAAQRAQVRSAQAQKCHIVLSLRAFVRLEAYRLQTGVSGYAAKANLIRKATRLYLRQPSITLDATA